MRFLLDQNLSPALVDRLTGAGHDAVHVRDLELSRAPDEVVMAAAAGAIVVLDDHRIRVRPLPIDGSSVS